MPSDKTQIIVEVYFEHGSDPFICSLYGYITLEGVKQIEQELIDGMETLFHSDGKYLFVATRFSGQYGEYGRCELEPGWELDKIAYRPVTGASN